MRCCARDSDSMVGEAEAVLGGGARLTAAVPALFSTVRKKKSGWVGWTKRSNKPLGRLG
jgi:hypothetical protein